MIERLRAEHADLVKRFQREKRRSSITWAIAAILIALLTLGGILMDHKNSDRINGLQGRLSAHELQEKKDAETLASIKLSIKEISAAIERGDSDKSILARISALESLTSKMNIAQYSPPIIQGIPGKDATPAQIAAAVAAYCAKHNFCRGPIGKTGATGKTGASGTDGTNGTNGTDGKDGASISSVSCFAAGTGAIKNTRVTFTFHLTNGVSITTTCTVR